MVDMMMELYDEQEILKSYVESERFDAENAAKIETAKRLWNMGRLIIDEVAIASGLPKENILELQKEQLQQI